MDKLDLTKHYKTYYSAKNTPELVDIEAVRYLSIAGKGDPSGAAYGADLQALYAVAYAVKFMCKADGNDFIVPKLEGQWDFDEEKYKNIPMAEAPLKIPRSEWNYRMLLRLPDFVTQSYINSAVHSVLVKKELVLAEKVVTYNLPAAKVVQMLHLGAFDNEPETLLKMQEFILEKRLQKNGQHQEIYLSDFRKVASEKLRTILREPVILF